MEQTAKTEWVIPDMYWPEITSGRNYVSHESVCVLNTGERDCEVRITLYYEDSDPVVLQPARCDAMRTHHIRMDRIRDMTGAPVRKGVPYAARVLCSVPVTVQYTRVDTSESTNAIMTTMAR
ncbi:sensory rhodopsin transducer [Marasmitruncus massiliensis]|uniref:sensory rhodopsin transducer n=1 Tax=Marasmitruncus massiliensis TaxID=1944642 RepID=UPI000C7DC7F0|nr:sensory rhodopsin transducer [Marasmitruncus massiliensis]